MSLKEESKCTTYYIISYGKVLDIACKSQIKSHHTPGHQLLLNCLEAWGPQDRSRGKHHLLSLPMANSKIHSADMHKVLASIPIPLKLGDLQSNEVCRSYRPVSTQKAAKKGLPSLKHSNVF